MNLTKQKIKGRVYFSQSSSAYTDCWVESAEALAKAAELGKLHFVNFGWGLVMSVLGIGFAYRMK